MRLLVISNMYPSESDKVYGTFVRNFVEDARRRNADGVTELVAIRGKRKGAAAKAAAYVSFYAKTLYKLIFKSYDIVYVHTITFTSIPLRVASWLRRLPLVFNVHGTDVLTDNKLKRKLRDIAEPLLPRAKMIVCPSEFFRNVLYNEFPGLANYTNIFVSPSGGLGPKFYYDKPKAPESQTLTLGFVSRIDHGKGWKTLLDAVALLRPRGIACRAIIAGKGAQSQQLEAAIKDQRLSDCVEYIGPQPQEQLPELYRNFDLFIFPSERESLGLVGIEAMAAGTPVIATKSGGPTHYIVNGHNGCLIEIGDSKALADRIEEFNALSKDDKLRLSEGALRTAADYHTDDVQRELYEKLLTLAGG